ncbi:MAG: leucine-rich repeat domain-containing protein [Oscillospiraceae bacterium]|nr:leucine-rich repeat domain-containing protein [Oscillospiraceae bacterium]
MKKLLSIMLAVCMIAALGLTVYADAAEGEWDAQNVTCVIIADGTTTVRAELYAGLTGITMVVIPASVTYIEPNAFADSRDSITTIRVVGGNTAVLNGVTAFTSAVVEAISQEEFETLVADAETDGDTKQKAGAVLTR